MQPAAILNYQGLTTRLETRDENEQIGGRNGNPKKMYTSIGSWTNLFNHLLCYANQREQQGEIKRMNWGKC